MPSSMDVRAASLAAGIGFAQSVPAESKQFDFLLGQWDVEVQVKMSGLAAAIHGASRLVGTMKASRVLDGLAVEDELRVVDVPAIRYP